MDFYLFCSQDPQSLEWCLADSRPLISHRMHLNGILSQTDLSLTIYHLGGLGHARSLTSVFPSVNEMTTVLLP